MKIISVQRSLIAIVKCDKPVFFEQVAIYVKEEQLKSHYILETGCVKSTRIIILGEDIPTGSLTKIYVNS